MNSSDPLYLLSDSPDDLYRQLTEMAPKEQLKGRQCYLALVDHEAIIRSFDIKVSQKINFRTQLGIDAMEFLSLPVNDIELDYEILEQDDSQIKGTYICMNRHRLGEYNYTLSKFGIYPLQVIPYALVVANYFLSQDLGDKQYILVDCFKPSWAVFGVFMKSRCIMVRLIHYESLEELRTEINASVLSACSKSPLKECSGLYVYGNYDKKEELLASYRSKFGDQIFSQEPIDLNKIFFVKNPVYILDLFKNEILSYQDYRKVFFYLNMACLVLLGIAGLMVFSIILQQNLIHQLEINLRNLK
jgi:hypothetical protein